MPNAFHYSNTFDDKLSNSFRGILSTDFVPPSSTSLKLWLDASDLKTRIKNASGQFISWMDKSGNNKHCNRDSVSAGNITDDYINGVNAMQFNNARFIIPNINIAPPITAFVVFKPSNSLATGIYPEYLIIDGSQFNTTGRKPMVHGTKATPNDMAMQFGNNSIVRPINDTALNFLRISTNNVSMAARVNTNEYSSNLGSKPIFATTDTGKIGAGGGTCVWGECLLYNKLLEAYEIQKIWSYLINKWQ